MDYTDEMKRYREMAVKAREQERMREDAHDREMAAHNNKKNEEKAAGLMALLPDDLRQNAKAGPALMNGAPSVLVSLGGYDTFLFYETAQKELLARVTFPDEIIYDPCGDPEERWHIRSKYFIFSAKDDMDLAIGNAMLSAEEWATMQTEVDLRNAKELAEYKAETEQIAKENAAAEERRANERMLDSILETITFDFRSSQWTVTEKLLAMLVRELRMLRKNQEQE